MTQPRLAFIDWMKCLGIGLIVFGHTSSAADQLVPPIYPKQLGVAFFLFATGFSLAREKRRVGRVLYNRLFEVFLFGVAIAFVVSVATYLQLGRLALSNYLPFFLGSNVVFNNFPANPTTWYIGTYLHVLLLWALVLKRLTIRVWMLPLVCALEILIRAFLMETCGSFVAYMTVPNWISCILLGTYYGRRGEQERTAPGLPRYLIGLCLLVVSWPWLLSSVDKEASFPFMELLLGPHLLNLCATSAAVTTVYISFTWLVYKTTRQLPETAAVKFIARNTLIVFIAHMPVFYELRDPVMGWTASRWLRSSIWFTVCFLLLALASECIRRLVQPEQLREKIWRLCTGRLFKKSQPEELERVGV